MKTYKIEITYDTGDSFHQEYGVKSTLPILWNDLSKAKQAIKDIEEHYHYVMIMEREVNAGKKERATTKAIAEKKPWFNKTYPTVSILLENDEGKRENHSSFWTGYFESLVSADILEVPEEGMSFKP